MPNKILQTLFICNGIFVLAQNLLGPLYAVYVQQVSSPNVVLISSSWAVYLASATFFTYLIVRFGDKAQHKDLLLAGFLIRISVWILYIFVKNIEMLIILQVLLGIGEAFGTPAFQAIFAEHLDKNRHVREYGQYQLINNAALAFATLLGGFIVKQFGFPVLFICMALTASISFASVAVKWKKLVI